MKRVLVVIWAIKAVMSFSWNFLVKVGKAASEYETPMSESEMVWILFERERMETEPSAMRAAMAMRNRKVIELMERVNVRGREIPTTFLINSQSGFLDRRGKRPDCHR